MPPCTPVARSENLRKHALMIQRNPKILIVDDEAFIRELIAATISNLGYDVTAVDSGTAALEQAREHIYDLVISDINMPEMNGHEFVEQLRSYPEYKMVPFIFLTGINEAQVWAKSLHAGADDYVTKPFDPAVLEAKVKANLKRAMLRKEELDYRKSHHLNFETGKVIFASANTYHLSSELIDAEVLVVDDDTTLFAALNNDDIWLLLVDEHADWALKVFEKVKSICSTLNLQITMLMELHDEQRIESYLNLGCADIVFRKDSKSIMAHEINARIQREVSYKYKYLNALNLAAKNAPIRLESDYQYRTETLNVSCFHQAFESLPGGDFYDVFKLNANEQLVVLGDVMGKKWGAWFFVMAYIAYIRCAIRFFANGDDQNVIKHPEKLMAALNDYVYKDLQLSEVFTTLTVVFVNHASSSVRISSAGALRPILYSKASDEVRELKVSGTLLGLLEGAQYQTAEVQLEADDSLLFFTDGYSEIIPEDSKEMIGKEGVIDLFLAKNQSGLSASNEFDDHFVSNANVHKFDDDRTLLMIKRSA